MKNIKIGAAVLAITVAGCQQSATDKPAEAQVAETSVILQCDGTMKSNDAPDVEVRRIHRIDLINKTLSFWNPDTSTWTLDEEMIAVRFDPMKIVFQATTIGDQYVLSQTNSFDRQLGTLQFTSDMAVSLRSGISRSQGSFTGPCKKVTEPDTSTVF